MNATLSGRLDTLNASVVILLSNITTLSDRLDAFITLATARIDTLNATLIGVQADVTALTGRVDNMNESIILLQGNVTWITAVLANATSNITSLYTLTAGMNATLSGRLDTLNASVVILLSNITTLSDRLDAFITFSITDSTGNIPNDRNFTLNVTTSSAATCTYEDIFAGTTGIVMSGNGSTSHTASVIAYITGLNVYRVTCVQTACGFSKSEDVLVRVLGTYVIDIPGNGVGFTTTFPGFLVSNYQLRNATGLSSKNLSAFFNSTAGPGSERLTTAGLFDGIVWRWDSNANSWDSYDLSSEDYDMSLSTLSYYQVQLKSNASGKSIRHDV
jgi:hypothetical protein